MKANIRLFRRATIVCSVIVGVSAIFFGIQREWGIMLYNISLFALYCCIYFLMGAYLKLYISHKADMKSYSDAMQASIKTAFEFSMKIQVLKEENEFLKDKIKTYENKEHDITKIVE
jgi:hypothetical protein